MGLRSSRGTSTGSSIGGAFGRRRVIRVHDTRHTCASLLAALDVHPRIAMQILRHSEIAVTMEVYTHVPSAETRKALRKLGKALDGSKPKPKGKKIKKRPGGCRES
ncbi:tyrosine-type recombinase/integrase [Streptomyces sp. NPDC056500]|uniref:tyrosine-type recombinase/integrase n=1 Tax=Streptomyces sp. NPDC056500 TaxID=3345840 RepID=UPI0036B99D0D